MTIYYGGLVMFCSKCGKEIPDEAAICVHCGVPTANYNTVAVNKDDKKSFGFALLGFFIPLVGLILWLCWKNDSPLKAKSAGKGALTGVIVSVVFYILWFALIIGLASSGYMS